MTQPGRELRATRGAGSSSYESFAETYWERIGAGCRWGRYMSDREQREILAAAAALEPGLALEVGCDGGRWCVLLADRGWRVAGMDVNASALALARQRVPTGSFVEAAGRELAAATGTVRLLLAIQVPAVAHEDWFPPEAARVLEPGGALVFSVNNKCSWRALKRNAPGEYRESYDSFARRLGEHGLTVRHARGAAWAPFRRTADSQLVPVSACLEQALGVGAVTRFGPLVIGTAYREPG